MSTYLAPELSFHTAKKQTNTRIIWKDVFQGENEIKVLLYSLHEFLRPLHLFEHLKEFNDFSIVGKPRPNGKWELKWRIKVKKTKDENFQWSQKLKSFLIMKMQFLPWFITYFRRYKREFDGI